MGRVFGIERRRIQPTIGRLTYGLVWSSVRDRLGSAISRAASVASVEEP
jgi:hypothetical protein